ncbi:NAD-dependent epimerase/dehydratase family protein [Dehalococcoidia bacterium]|nr:NAD-dependent epimerase/dehydratase family protein [Dehalococcoidia bacterium]
MSFNAKRILVTGSSGFVGRYLVEELRRYKAEIITLTEPDGEKIDVRDWQRIRELDGIDMVYHLAAKTYVPYSFENPKETYEVNVLGTLNILELCRRRNIRKIVYLSSYVYGQPKCLPIDEEHPVQPTNPYMRSKILAEELCRGYSYDYGIKCVILRAFNLYGIGQSGDFLIPSITSQLREGKITLKDGEPKRDYIYIRDLISALIAAGKYNGGFEIFNIGYGKSYSVEEIVAKMVRLYGKDVEVNYKNERRKNEIMNVVADIRKARKELGWCPKVNIDDGLTNIISDLLLRMA